MTLFSFSFERLLHFRFSGDEKDGREPYQIYCKTHPEMKKPSWTWRSQQVRLPNSRCLSGDELEDWVPSQAHRLPVSFSSSCRNWSVRSTSTLKAAWASLRSGSRTTWSSSLVFSSVSHFYRWDSHSAVFSPCHCNGASLYCNIHCVYTALQIVFFNVRHVFSWLASVASAPHLYCS